MVIVHSPTRWIIFAKNWKFINFDTKWCVPFRIFLERVNLYENKEHYDSLINLLILTINLSRTKVVPLELLQLLWDKYVEKNLSWSIIRQYKKRIQMRQCKRIYVALIPNFGKACACECYSSKFVGKIIL